MKEPLPTIGLEIHAELTTESKMFCGSKNDPESKEPNQNICPVCMGHPGTLPVINREAIHHVLRIGAALGGTLADYTEFDRKNYFYPDIPKNYQISQYKYPLVSGGTLHGVEITRVHLEEDTARSSHDKGDYSLVDFNRAGVPLMELVTEPVIHDAKQAVSFARELRLLLRYLGASHANLEIGQMRIEANVSVAPEGELGTKVEVKNLNSFKAVEKAIAYELKRQRELLEHGKSVIQETRGWDEHKQHTFSQRAKEGAHDYRYFPDPDLPKVYISELDGCDSAAIAESLPELPSARRERYTSMYEVGADVIEQFVQNEELGRILEEATKYLADSAHTMAANYLCSDVLGHINDTNYSGRQLSDLSGVEFSTIINLAADGTLSSRGAKDVLILWMQAGGDPRQIVKNEGLAQKSNVDEISKLALDILNDNREVVDEYRSGKEASLQYLVGQGMKRSKGSANPQILAVVLKKTIAEQV